MGYIGNLPTSRHNSFKQIRERLAIRRHQEDVLDSDVVNLFTTSKRERFAGIYQHEIIGDEFKRFLRLFKNKIQKNQKFN